MQKLFQNILSATLLVAIAASASAASLPPSMLRLSSGTITNSVYDGQMFIDKSPLAGSVKYSGYVGTWNVTVVGKSLGTVTSPSLSLGVSKGIVGAGTDTLIVEFTQTGFDPGNFLFTDAFGGAGAGIGAEVTIKAWADATDTAFGHGTFLGSRSFGPASDIAIPYDGYTDLLKGFSSAFSITLEFDITHAGSANTPNARLDAVSVPDSGATAPLLALSLFGLFVVAHRSKVLNHFDFLRS